MDVELVTKRVRAEFEEMPGMTLTMPQASRLFGIEREICKNIVERHRGDIHLTSAVGEGTIVSIWLPLTQDVQLVKG